MLREYLQIRLIASIHYKVISLLLIHLYPLELTLFFAGLYQ